MEALEDERGKGGAPGEAIHMGMIWCVFDHHKFNGRIGHGCQVCVPGSLIELEEARDVGRGGGCRWEGVRQWMASARWAHTELRPWESGAEPIMASHKPGKEVQCSAGVLARREDPEPSPLQV